MGDIVLTDSIVNALSRRPTSAISICIKAGSYLLHILGMSKRS